MDFGNGTPKQILSAAAHTLLSLRGCRGGNGNQVQSLLSAMGRLAPVTWNTTLLCQSPTGGGGWEKSLTLPKSGPEPVRLSVCICL